MTPLLPTAKDANEPPLGLVPGPLAADERLSMGTLMRFQRLMQREGWPVALSRMCYDRLYAYERIVQAHASAHDPLRAIALELFQIYHRVGDRPPAATND